ncbi:hypothetical protein EXIGLDRAFT_62777 [Exidia glandulosa HHB12029]|uniref:Uncharacterized protein n=1 Tax=Exidia glandulosa HHB12029 TaxID=1314781 RepID=A0A165P014_EXIGL|nr:hypothetical protein EXIGLDRAFT_62777 [Exidia glandulosa HHB12029]
MPRHESMGRIIRALDPTTRTQSLRCIQISARALHRTLLLSSQRCQHIAQSYSYSPSNSNTATRTNYFGRTSTVYVIYNGFNTYRCGGAITTGRVTVWRNGWKSRRIGRSSAPSASAFTRFCRLFESYSTRSNVWLVLGDANPTRRETGRSGDTSEDVELISKFCILDMAAFVDVQSRCYFYVSLTRCMLFT